GLLRERFDLRCLGKALLCAVEHVAAPRAAGHRLRERSFVTAASRHLHSLESEALEFILRAEVHLLPEPREHPRSQRAAVLMRKTVQRLSEPPDVLRADVADTQLARAAERRQTEPLKVT